MSVSETTGGPFDIGRVIQRTFGLIGRNFVPFLLLALLFKAVPEIVIGLLSLKVQGAALADNPFAVFSGPAIWVSLVGGLVGVVSVFVLQAALLRGAIADLNGSRASLGDMLSTGFRFFLPMLGLAIVFGLSVGAGILFLIVPGVMMAVTWCAAAPSIVAEKKGVFASMARSARLTSGHRWSIFGLLVIYAVVSWIIGIIGAALMLAGGTDLTAMMTVSVFSQAVVGTITALIGAAGSASLYYELRSIKEGVGADTLASVFD